MSRVQDRIVDALTRRDLKRLGQCLQRRGASAGAQAAAWLEGVATQLPRKNPRPQMSQPIDLSRPLDGSKLTQPSYPHLLVPRSWSMGSVTMRDTSEMLSTVAAATERRLGRLDRQNLGRGLQLLALAVASCLGAVAA